MVKKHWIHTYNYGDFVRFVTFDLGDAVLNKYMTYIESHKNAGFLSANTVVQCMKVISEWMKEKTWGNKKNVKILHCYSTNRQMKITGLSYVYKWEL